MKQKKSVEDYLKTIYILSRKKDVHGADIAKAIGVSRPTVCVSLKALTQEGYMKEHLSRHETLKELSDRFDISLTTMKTCFKSVYGCSVYAYMKSYRMQAAMLLLRDTADSITEIAAKMGYDNPSKFSETFKKEFGQLPSDFRKSLSK